MNNESNPTKEEVFSKSVGLDITSEDCHKVHILKETLERGLNAVERHIKAQIQVTKSVSITDEDFINKFKELNPYPSDVFTEPTDEQWKAVAPLLQANNIVPDRIFGKWGRMVWENAAKRIEELLSCNVISIQREAAIKSIIKTLHSEPYMESLRVSEVKAPLILESILSSGALQEEKPEMEIVSTEEVRKSRPMYMNRADAIKVVKDVYKDMTIHDKGTYQYWAGVVVAALVDSGHLTNHLPEGKQREPEDFKKRREDAMNIMKSCEGKEPYYEVVIDMLIQAHYLTDGKQEPLKFEEWVKLYGNEGFNRDIINPERYKGYLTNFKQ